MKNGGNTGYEDIINLPHHEPKGHPRMSMEKRAAQFSPFAALSGYEEAVLETERLTEEQITLEGDELEILDNQLRAIMGSGSQAEVEITYFIPDGRKAGGKYETVQGKISKVEGGRKLIIMENGLAIPIKDIIKLNGRT